MGMNKTFAVYIRGQRGDTEQIMRGPNRVAVMSEYFQRPDVQCSFGQLVARPVALESSEGEIGYWEQTDDGPVWHAVKL